MRIIPAILESNIKEVQNKLTLIDGLAELIQIDIMDGKFVPQVSVKLKELANLKHKTDLEVHLMVKDPEKYFAQAEKLKVKRVFWHYEATGDVESVIRKAKKYSFKNGLAINPETPVEKIIDLLDQFAAVLFLGVHPGKQGQSFIPETVARIRQLRRLRPDLTIAVDGGVSEKTIKELKEAGVDDFIIGSALVKTNNPAEKYQFFQSLL